MRATQPDLNSDGHGRRTMLSENGNVHRLNQLGTLAALIGSYALASCCPCFLVLFSGWEDGDLVPRPIGVEDI
jgi:hypothetical protein